MIEAAELEPGDPVMEVGPGSGHAAAVMAEIAGRVFTIEQNATLASRAGRRCAELCYRNTTVHAASAGSAGERNRHGTET